MQPEPVLTLNEDLSEREDHPLHVPWQETWRRQAYETVLSKAWPLVVGPLVGHGIGSRAYMPVEVEPRLRPVAAHLAFSGVSVSDQEAFLQAVGVDPKDRGTWPRGLGGGDWGDRRYRTATAGGLQRAIRDAFIETLAWTLAIAFGLQTRYDLALGMPKRLERHPLELPGGTRIWAKHLASRRMGN